MALRNLKPSGDPSSVSMVPLKISRKVPEMVDPVEPDVKAVFPVESDVDIDLREVYFIIMQFLSIGPFKRTCGQFWNELSEHQLLPRRYHAWYSRSGSHSRDEDDDGKSLPLCYQSLVERYPHIEKDHLVRLLKQLFLSSQVHGMVGGFAPKAADVPTILGSGSFSLLGSVRDKEEKRANPLPGYLRWPHMQADQVRGLSLREIGGGFTKHHRASSVRAACYVISKPSTLVQKMQIIKKMRGHQNAVYCAIFDRSGRYVITGSDDRLVKIWSMETAFCLASCRGHEGDITDLAVSSNNTLVASSSNDFIIRVWRLPDGLPISVLRGHAGAVTAIAFSPRPGSYQLLSSSDDGTCRIWDARSSQVQPRIYVPKPPDTLPGRSNDPSSSTGQQSHQILCCAYNANGTVFVTGSSDTFARVWNACKATSEDSQQPNHEMDALSGHENDVNYVQFSGCAVASRSSTADAIKEDNIPKFKNSWFTHDNIVTCSRDGSAIIWIPKSRRSHGKVGRWTRAYHLKVPPPPMPPQPPRGGPRQRFQPTPRGVNMIVWSLDNHFVLAAIMDCRICVWNASDGSLVHSLTGHSESTFVLDVHPFNPRIAMSAGYDGKTIIWDIWEGIPVRVYEVGRFKLVDGKFSPDGTSIILSDEVGQIFIIATGQGESQKDAQYDQFFLGDYRPLIQDANGNVLDQETQLVPYRRNVQDLLCDSSMIPYPDPYQSLYQKRRLGTLGIEWHPPSVKFAVGPTYNTSTGDFQMLPILDLDRWVEPLPEFLDNINWEPENEVQSDDNDSEYNMPEEYSSEGEHESLSESSSGEPECSAEDSDVEHKRKDAPRRSKRKKHKSEVEFTTSSGRRVKRRNLDECDGTHISRTHRKRRSKNGRLTLKKKSSKAKTLRPQRRAARNALNLFSKIGDSSEEEDEDQFERTSESESEFPDSNTQSIESESTHQSERKHPEDKVASKDEFEDVAKPSENQANPGRRRLVLKFPLRDSKSAISVENFRSENRELESMTDAIPKANSDASNLKGTSSTAFQPVQSFGDITDAMVLETFKSNGREQVEKSDQCISASHGGSTIKWGEVKARSFKRLKLSDTVSPDAWLPSNTNLDHPSNIRDDANGHLKSEDENGMSSNSGNQARLDNNLDRKEWQCGNGAPQGLDVASTEECPPEYNFKLPVSRNSSANLGLLDQVTVPLPCNDNITDTLQHIDNGYQDNHDISEATGIHEPIRGHKVITDDKHVCYTTGRNQEVERNTLKFRIKANEFTKETNSLSSKLKYALEGSRSFEHDLMSNLSPPAHQSSVPVMPEEDGGTSAQSPEHSSAQSPDHSDWNDDVSGSLDSWEVKSQFSKKTHVDSHSKRYSVVNKRSKSSRGRKVTESDQRVEESTSKSYNHSNALVGTVRRTRSMGTKANATTDGVSRREQFPLDDWRSSSKTVGLRSQRSRRENYSSNQGSMDKRKYEQPGRKLSWLMLVEHEESYRYIPQQGDIVAYLRQGHEEYIKDYRLPSQEAVSLKKLALKAVEICKVRQLDYSTHSGSGESCCKLILEFIESSSNLFRKTFKLTLPELVSFPDFLVEKTRYDAAIARNWTHRDKCKVWWRNEVGDGGSWWEGRILTVKPKSPDLPESPWERYVVQYRNDFSGQHSHSPWELHDADTQWEHPHINVEIRDKLFSLISKLEETSIKKDKYGIQNLNQVAQKSYFFNRFPVPLSIDIIKRRLRNNYYRTLEAVEHDASIMLSNAESYFGKNVEMATKIRRLRDRFTDIFSSL